MEYDSMAHPYQNDKAMAEISANHPKAHGEKVRAKKLSTKTDMTPMVDLAFLLLAFFILTTTFMKPSVITLTMPEPLKNPGLAPELSPKNALTFVLAENNNLYWWGGVDPSAEMTDYSKDGVRKILLERSKANPRLMVLIKPMDKSRYENVVDILDEVEITNIARYAIVDFTEEDLDKIP